MVTSVLFALQMTAVTPLSASTSSQHIENQQQASIEGVLASAEETGALRRAVLFWNGSTGRFHDTTTDSYYTRKAPPNDFGDRLERAFDDRGIGYNVYVIYYSESGGRRVDEMVYQGAPSDNAVRSGRTVVLTDGDRLYDDGERRTAKALNGSSFYAEDVSPDSPTYNVVRVEVVAWRI
jgi:hypothetical protein